VGVVVQRDDGHETVVKGNDDDGWCSGYGRDKMEMRLDGGDSGKG
jgi:hypothetical protein